MLAQPPRFPYGQFGLSVSGGNINSGSVAQALQIASVSPPVNKNGMAAPTGFNQITLPQAGLYLVTAAMMLAQSSNSASIGNGALILLKGGTEINRNFGHTQTTNESYISYHLNVMVFAAAGDLLTFQGYGGTLATQAMSSDSRYSYAHVAQISY